MTSERATKQAKRWRRFSIYFAAIIVSMTIILVAYAINPNYRVRLTGQVVFLYLLSIGCIILGVVQRKKAMTLLANGKKCPNCGYLQLNNDRCNHCGADLSSLANEIGEGKKYEM